MNPRELSRQLRTSEHQHVRRRRGVVGLSLLAAGCMGAIALYQMGIIKHLPEPRVPGLDADKVDEAKQAYSWFNMPDGVVGLRSYATTAALAAAGGEDRARENPWMSIAMTAKVLGDCAMAAKLTYDQWARHKAFCSYCLVAAGATFAMLPLVLPEAREALKHLKPETRRQMRQWREQASELPQAAMRQARSMIHA